MRIDDGSDVMLDLVAGGDTAPAVQVLESCHSAWIFEPARRRFRRLPRGASLEWPSTESDWTIYYRLDVDTASGAFSVGLSPDDTRVLRSWVHTEPCRHCVGEQTAAAEQTAELSVEMLRGAANEEPAA